MTTLALVDLESLEDSTTPVYLTPSSIYRAYVHEKQRRKDLERSGVFIREDPDKIKGPKWRVQEPNVNAWREKTFDDRTLYGARAEMTKTPSGYPARSRPPTPYKDTVQEDDHIELKREKTYIQQTTRASHSAGRGFWSQTIKHYNRPVEGSYEVPYRSPRAFPTRAEEARQLLLRSNPKFTERPVESITKFPKKLKYLPRLLSQSECRAGGQPASHFCDVLGPGSCHVCIESANRRIAGEVQRQAFPQLENSVTALVAPRLFKSLTLSEKTSRLRQRLASRAIPRDHRSSLKSSILKFPGLQPGDGADRFGRAGIERLWAGRASTILADQQHSGQAEPAPS